MNPTEQFKQECVSEISAQGDNPLGRHPLLGADLVPCKVGTLQGEVPQGVDHHKGGKQGQRPLVDERVQGFWVFQ